MDLGEDPVQSQLHRLSKGHQAINYFGSQPFGRIIDYAFLLLKKTPVCLMFRFL